MESVLVFEFEHCVEIFSPKKPVTMRDFCFRPLPDAHFRDMTLDMLKTARGLGFTTVLVAYSSQILVKEALLKLDACMLFDDFFLLDELVEPNLATRETAEKFLVKKYGNDYRFITDFSKNLVLKS